MLANYPGIVPHERSGGFLRPIRDASTPTASRRYQTSSRLDRFGTSPPSLLSCMPRLCHERAGGRALVPPGRWQGADGLVVAGQTVDAGLDEDEAEFAVLVLAVALEVLADRDGLRKMVCQQSIKGGDMGWCAVWGSAVPS